jgi:hypothetical protein
VQTAYMRRFGVATEEEDERRKWHLAKRIAVWILITVGVIFVGSDLYVYLAARAAALVVQEATQQIQRDLRTQAEARRLETERRMRRGGVRNWRCSHRLLPTRVLRSRLERPESARLGIGSMSLQRNAKARSTRAPRASAETRI